MMWLVLIVGVVIAVPIIIELNRRPMDDVTRGKGPGQFADLPQGTTHYCWHGPASGPTIICVHGLTTPSFVWGGMVRGLTAMGFRVLTYDLYGRGYSARVGGDQDAAFFVRQLADLMTHENIRGRVTLIGFSMGGAIAASYAATFPDRMRHLILLASAGMVHAMGPEVRFMRDVPAIGDWLTLAYYPRVARHVIRAERATPGSVLNIGEMQEAELDFKGYLPAVLSSLRGILARPMKDTHHTIRDAKVPVLAIWGGEDTTIPLSAIGLLTEWNRDATQEVIDGAGHGLPYTHTDEVLRVLEGWLAQQPDTA
ncbi:alpha/beta fold hydrolase [Sulfitobacter aestuariivivens]|uniref:Alpha/beta hydrolase n=1 Tax=Sulfitobacter aestuariivivens TaxID=2766981 RepID=A0A927D5Q5_9RHOB|nr:alpha/beta hydrolase [Sulfitobacter aestuariivivens]MBD3665613.1 alpha/beta hydrolase [Sulfitobacter aestuariivivens]